jgi:hypothetical protein
MILKERSGHGSLIMEAVCLLQIYVLCLLHIYVVLDAAPKCLFASPPQYNDRQSARSMHAGAAEISLE